MEIVNTLAFWLHFIGLSLGGVAAFGIPLTAARIAGAEPAARPALAQVIQVFSKVGSAGIGTLILTGLILTFSKIGGFAGQSPWFNAKLALVVLLVGVIVVNKKLGAKAMQGDAQAAARTSRVPGVPMSLMPQLAPNGDHSPGLRGGATIECLFSRHLAA